MEAMVPTTEALLPTTVGGVEEELPPPPPPPPPLQQLVAEAMEGPMEGLTSKFLPQP